MANPERGEIDLEVGGKRYRLKLGTMGLRVLQEALSTPAKPVTFIEVMDGVFKGNIDYLLAVIWAASQHHHPELTQKDVDHLLDGLGGVGDSLPIMIDTAHKLMESSKPDKKDRGVVKKTTGVAPTLAVETADGTTGMVSISKRVKSA